MDRELVGYLLNALDEPTHRQVEERLAQDLEYQQKLDLLRHALEPLEADAEPPAPPPGLIAKTIALAAEHMCRPLPMSPAPRLDSPVIEVPWWRRVDVLLAACLLIAVIGLAGPMLLRSHVDRSQNAQCQENLRAFHAALEVYHQEHGSYPNVAGEKPRHAAGMVVPILRHTGALKPMKPVSCPGVKEARSNELPLDQLRAMNQEAFDVHAPDLNPSYAYSLGFVNDTGYHAPCQGVDGVRSLMPLMADAPHFDGGGDNSPNHGGRGQNVLFQDGHVKFLKTRLAGVDGDDIYLNKARRVAAGLDPLDTVLGCSAAKP